MIGSPKPGKAGRTFAGSRLATLLALSLLILLCRCGAAHADIYWGNFLSGFESGIPSWIGHARLNGSEANAQFLAVDEEHPARLAADGEYLYATFPGKEGSSIGRSRLDGSEPNAYFVVAPGPAPLDGAYGLAVTPEYIYWTNDIGQTPDEDEGEGEGEEEETPAEIGRARINGTEVIQNFITLPEDHDAIDLAADNGYLYWSGENEIGRANINGTEVDPEFIEGEEGDEVGFAASIAVNHEHIYWTHDAYNEGTKEDEGQIGEASIDGGDIDSSFIEGLREVDSGAITLDASHIYWSDQGNGSIGRANLNGGEVNEDFIPDAGDPDGLTTDHRIIVNSTEDYKAAEPANGICAAKEHETLCTLRAAIEVVNAEHKTSPVPVGVEIPGGELAKIKLKEELPKIESPIDLDARSQPGALVAGKRKIGLIVSGASISGEHSGLELGADAPGSTIAGLQIEGFAKVGVLLEGEDQQLADSVLTSDTIGAEVAANNDTVGYGKEIPGDIFYADGRSGLVKLLEEHNKQKISEFESAADGLGADVALAKPSSGTHIVGDDIGVHGPGFSAAPDKLEDDGLSETFKLTSALPIGVMIIPKSETTQISNITIGGPGEEANVDSGTIFGVLALTGESSTPISNLSILDTSFGGDTSGQPLEPIGNAFGVLAGGPINGLQLGAAGAGNTFQGDLVGATVAGEQVHSLDVQGNTFGRSLAIGKLAKGLEGHEVMALVLPDVQNALIGGAGAGQGNNFPGDVIAIAMDGKHLANDSILDNTIGTAPSTPFTTFDQAPEMYSTIIGVMTGSPFGAASAPGAQNLTLSGNTIQGALGGVFNENVKGLTMTGNTIENDAIGMLDSGSGGERIGLPGEGNSFLNDGFGLLDTSEDPAAREDEQASVNPKDTEKGTREQFLSAPDENLAFDGIDAISTAELGAGSANTSAQPGEDNSIMGNRFGIDSGGVAHPNELSALVGGDEHALQFGGTGSGQGNVLEDNRTGGLLIGGTGSHLPTVQVLGNTIYNNENFTGTVPIPGLGINLISEEGIGAGALGVDPQDPEQPAGGANHSQNSPVLSSAVAEAGTLTLGGSLHGVANTNYLIEVFADEAANPFGAGEGQTLLGRLSLATNGEGNVAFTSTFADPGAGYRYISSTATTVPGGGEPGVTSEFSVDQAIVRPGGATSPPAPTTTPTPTTTTTTGKGAATTTVSTSGSTATTAGTSVTLPAKASCSSAGSTPCTVTTTATIPAATAGKASVSAYTDGAFAAKAKPVAIGHGSMTLARGASAPIHLTLTRHGLALLRSHHTLSITVTIKISGHGRATITRTLHLKLKYRKPGKRR